LSRIPWSTVLRDDPFPILRDDQSNCSEIEQSGLRTYTYTTDETQTVAYTRETSRSSMQLIYCGLMHIEIVLEIVHTGQKERSLIRLLTKREKYMSVERIPLPLCTLREAEFIPVTAV